ncbi:MAG: hypothetical protein O7A03_12150 [Alphaproteobacteria bacterium]|nr:hypothetical protein [Alphaproteobacteria bacterium]
MRRLGAYLLAIMIAACATAEPPPDFPEPSFEALDPIYFEVPRLRVASNYRPPLAAPNVDHKFPVSIEDAAKSWALARLRATGKISAENRVGDEAVFVIDEAWVIETALETVEGLAGLLKNENAFRYDAKLKARLVMRRGPARGEVEVTITRSHTLLENATVNDRDAVWYAMMEIMMEDLDAEMEKNIALHLADFIR